jgi:vancomycin resistance protein VanJ
MEERNRLMLLNFVGSFLKRLWAVTRGLFWTGLWIFGLGLLVWYPLRWWPGDRWFPVRMANHLMPWLLVGLIPGLLIAGLAYRRWLVLTLAVPTAIVGLTFAPLFLPRFSIALAGTDSFKVMSYNVWHRNKNVSAAAAIIRQEQPDILLLQEVNFVKAQVLKKALADLYPGGKFYFAYEPYVYQAVISRYPLISTGTTRQQGRVQKVLVETPDGPIAVWNVHSYQPIPWSQQYRQIFALAQEIAKENGPLIVAGDFNTTEEAETYQLVDQHLSNAHWEAGWGFGFSFPSSTRRIRGKVSLPSLVRIDHIFYSDHFFARKAGTLSSSGGSDHFPVVAELVRVK